MNDLITGSFADTVSAERAIDRLQQLGYQPSDISVLMNEETKSRYIAKERGESAAQGAGVGHGIGGAVGAVIAGVVATGSVVALAGTGGGAVPLVAGPLAAALAGAGAGGIGGGLVGALIGVGIPRDRAEQYQADLENGRIVVGVNVRGGSDAQARQVLQSEGAQNVQREYAGAAA